MRAERVVVDTNVLISALLQPSGRTAATFTEWTSRLMRPKFDRYAGRTTRKWSFGRTGGRGGLGCSNRRLHARIAE